VNSCVCGEIVQVLPLGYRFPTFEGIKNAGIIKKFGRKCYLLLLE
jgi:hypothetical protein